MKRLETIKGLGYSDLRHDDIYVKDLNVSLKVTYNMLFIQSLDGAMVPGKTCRNWRIYYNDCDLLNHIQGDWNGYIMKVLNDGEIGNFKHYVDDVKSVQVFSPWANLKPVKAIPKKWTLKHVRNLYANNQITKAECKGYYSDDYAYDAAVNFRRGETPIDELIEDVVNTPSGWWIRQDSIVDGLIKLTLCCHTFHSNVLYVKL